MIKEKFEDIYQYVDIDNERFCINDDFYSNLVCLLNLEYHEDKVREILNKMLNDIMKENKFDDEAKFLINLIRNNEKYSDVYKKIEDKVSERGTL